LEWIEKSPSLRRTPRSERSPSPDETKFYQNIAQIRGLIETSRPKKPYYYFANEHQVQAAQLVRQFPGSPTGLFVYRLKTTGSLDYVYVAMKMGNGPLDIMSFSCYVDEEGNYQDIQASKMDFQMNTENPQDVRIDDIVLRFNNPSPRTNVDWNSDYNVEAFAKQFNRGFDLIIDQGHLRILHRL